MEWKNIYKGMLMGVSDLIPGVSGGTVAFILGIYDRLLASINGFFSREWKKHIGFLIPLAIGMGSAILLLSKLIDYLLENHYDPTQFFFLGLIIGVLPFIVKEADVKSQFTTKHYVILTIVAIFLASLAFVKPVETAVITSLSLKSGIGLFFSGWMASMAMLLPGISGSFILLILGVYSSVIAAISSFNIPIIMVVGAGVALGFIVSSKVISYLLKNHHFMTYAVIIGLIVGSIFVVFPGVPSSTGTMVASIATFAAGLGITLYFSRKNA
ncbi:DUF368 domain-containing protein [Bacillus sp. AGMB 02131]|uniref:DUF368 domain-containing protein n=1 Tax=Peribacillus faecalis TaxID=2772559 RepID=A0A927D1C2_9BACI|nr:DUF368 domain-containing protein [Peribacillus faecalis]MBD3109229.1 DUF368 domain-containing protein [Peribacillus faecalis]